MVKGAIVQITTACNLRCASCKTYLTKSEFLNWSRDWLIELRKQGFWYLSLTGGEPTLHPEFVEMLKTMKCMGFLTHIATNGTNLVKIKEAVNYMDAITISIDDYIPQLHDNFRGRNAFNKALECAKFVKGKVKIATVNMLVNNENADRVLAMAEFANKEIGLPLSLCFPENSTYVFSNDFNVSKEKVLRAFILAYENYRKFVFGNTREYYRQCIDYINGGRVSKCKAGKTIFYIDVKGNVHACFKHSAPPPNCNECFIQCFREPSLFNPILHGGTFLKCYLKGKI